MLTYEVPEEINRLFVRAEAYRLLVFGGEVCEKAGRCFPYSERHLHALWFDDRWRPKKLKTSRGEPVTVEHPGRWNLEAGPDFRGAALLVGREQRRVAGDIEIHIFPKDWKSHGHSADPRYSNVRFHITWFPGGADEKLFPPGTIHIALSGACETDLESIDISAYPYAEPRARAPLRSSVCDADRGRLFLESAGEERIRQKTVRLAWLMQRCGEAQAVYEETAAALGYKQNKESFRRLAQRLPLEALSMYGADWKRVYAVLLGVSGLIPRQPGSNWPEASKKELRSLWDLWWCEQHKWEDVVPLDRTDWCLAGLRPLNHPVRRLAALAQWVANGLFSNLAADDAFMRRSADMQRRCFWSTHTGWSGKEKPAELVGKDRAKAIELNVIVPYRMAKGNGPALKSLPVEPLNSMIRETACTLFGPDHTPGLYRSALARQGLIQIFNDFVLTGRLAELSL